ncbi:polysaccharide export protein [Sphingobium sp. AR-3-1]|uniref:Polysaccharide export protein n=1 Tax=Sphingobium psychrophilum TaxID=2728834 RepID=A0A7X9WZG7_9SPHN|nr:MULTISPECIES: polysaccharide biosynthesis/export family protein [Sphingobium]NML12781.1 polysaccharide export protein [Sphingobium psychrophilum]PBN41947.1 polysaccharide biosynthesis protein GumB [Sphingobium sp. D43FB]
MKRSVIAAVATGLALSACVSRNVSQNVEQGSLAYERIPAFAGEPKVALYRIGELDRLDITFFQEAEMSAKGMQVDAAGDITMPLVGRVHAAGLTTTELAEKLRQSSARFYVDPQVTVSVTSSVSQNVTVQGQVTEPGIFPIQGPTTLLDTVALAKGETENAALDKVVVIRFIGDKRYAAAFDLGRIRRAEDQDPAIMARDVIIVGHSGTKQAWHDFLRAAPLLNVFAQF